MIHFYNFKNYYKGFVSVNQTNLNGAIHQQQFSKQYTFSNPVPYPPHESKCYEINKNSPITDKYLE